jgi:hypothetical protein
MTELGWARLDWTRLAIQPGDRRKGGKERKENPRDNHEKTKIDQAKFERRRRGRIECRDVLLEEEKKKKPAATRHGMERELQATIGDDGCSE